jgi:NAD(P)-dependent dehydrogenase (short-subunit alcohol dehydrogenase family)
MQKGDVALVTGASTGIGAGFVTYAAVRGPLDRPEAAELLKGGCQVVELDVTSPESCGNCVKEVRERSGRIDILINNAGVNAPIGPIEADSDEPFRYTMEANYFGAARMIRLIVPEMRERKKGAIVNITSVAAVFWLPTQGPYNASKAALETLSTTLSQEVARFGIHVCTIRPGVIITPLLTKSNPPNIAALKPYLDQLRHFSKFFQVAAEKNQTANLVADKIMELLQDSGSWKAGYDVGEDAAALGKAMRELGADWLAQEGGKPKSDPE